MRSSRRDSSAFITASSALGSKDPNPSSKKKKLIRASERIGAKGIWPKQVYELVFHPEGCVQCGNCVEICNFDAFSIREGEIAFDRERCWGCTLLRVCRQ